MHGPLIERLRQLPKYTFTVLKGLDGIKLHRYPDNTGKYIEYTEALEIVKEAEEMRTELVKLRAEHKKLVEERVMIDSNSTDAEISRSLWKNYIKDLKALINKTPE